MQAAQVQDVQVERQREYRVSPQWKANVVESCVNRYRMKISPLSFSTERASFSWRAPGSGTIMSPNAFIECRFTVSAPTQQDLKTMLAPTYQVLDSSDQSAAGNEAPFAGFPPPRSDLLSPRYALPGARWIHPSRPATPRACRASLPAG